LNGGIIGYFGSAWATNRMAPKEPLHIPLRWEFYPLQQQRTGIVSWRWRAFTQAGTLSKESEKEFDTLTECMEDAKLNGYGMR